MTHRLGGFVCASPADQLGHPPGQPLKVIFSKRSYHRLVLTFLSLSTGLANGLAVDLMSSRLLHAVVSLRSRPTLTGPKPPGRRPKLKPRSATTVAAFGEAR